MNTGEVRDERLASEGGGSCCATSFSFSSVPLPLLPATMCPRRADKEERICNRPEAVRVGLVYVDCTPNPSAIGAPVPESFPAPVFSILGFPSSRVSHVGRGEPPRKGSANANLEYMVMRFGFSFVSGGRRDTFLVGSCVEGEPTQVPSFSGERGRREEERREGGEGGADDASATFLIFFFFWFVSVDEEGVRGEDLTERARGRFLALRGSGVEMPLDCAPGKGVDVQYSMDSRGRIGIKGIAGVSTRVRSPCVVSIWLSCATPISTVLFASLEANAVPTSFNGNGLLWKGERETEVCNGEAFEELAKEVCTPAA